MSSDAEYWDARVNEVGSHAAAWSEDGDGIEETLTWLFHKSNVEFRPEGLYADLGCGYGRIVNRLAMMYPECRFVGMDVSALMLGDADWINVLEANDLVLLDGSGFIRGRSLTYDGFYSILMFQHITNEQMERYIHSVARLLKHGGWFRFQFVEGDYAVDRDHRRSTKTVIDWLNDARLSTRSRTWDGGRENWTWIMAVKP